MCQEYKEVMRNLSGDALSKHLSFVERTEGVGRESRQVDDAELARHELRIQTPHRAVCLLRVKVISEQKYTNNTKSSRGYAAVSKAETRKQMLTVLPPSYQLPVAWTTLADTPFQFRVPHSEILGHNKVPALDSSYTNVCNAFQYV
ncbi:unnamed protein product [Leptosia nina]|uniref:Uncharacterized protein n=1 Tax=Leptosia nina TaxID=320188 RepID=A0AAV1IUF3_9NEOP